MTKKKLKPITKLKKELDTFFSRFIRLKYSDKNGMAECYTCGIKKPWKEQQNGHFISRANLKYRFDEENCRCQCVSCNVFKNGNYIIYTQKMQQELGMEKVAEMTSIRSHHEITKLDRFWYEDKINYYKGAVKVFEKEKG